MSDMIQEPRRLIPAFAENSFYLDRPAESQVCGASSARAARLI